VAEGDITSSGARSSSEGPEECRSKPVAVHYHLWHRIIVPEHWLGMNRDRSPLQPHIDCIQDAYRKLSNAQFTIPEQILALVILASLPGCWDNVVTLLHTTLMAFSPSDRDRNFTASFVTSRLLEHEKLTLIRENTSDRVAAFTAHSAKNRKRCSNCRRGNHYFSECTAEGGPKHASKPLEQAGITRTAINYESDEESAL